MMRPSLALSRRAVVRRASVVFALSALAVTALTVPAAHAQDQFFDTNGDVIGVVNGNAFVGSVNPLPFTVTADAGTNVAGFLSTHNKATLNMSGGTVGNDLYASGNSVVNFSGGTVGGHLVADNSVVNLSGGTVGQDIYAYNNGVFCIFGSGLSSTLLNPNAFGFYSLYSLSGFLSDGTDITGKNLFVQNNSASFKLINAADVPEPGAVAFGLLAAGSVLGLIARKRK